MMFYCHTVECKSHRSKAKKLRIYPFMADMKRSAQMATWSVILSTFPGVTLGSRSREDQKGNGLQRPIWVWVLSPYSSCSWVSSITGCQSIYEEYSESLNHWIVPARIPRNITRKVALSGGSAKLCLSCFFPTTKSGCLIASSNYFKVDRITTHVVIGSSLEFLVIFSTKT